MTRHDANLALPWRDDSRAIRSNQTAVRKLDTVPHLQHVIDRDPLGNGNHQSDSGIDCLQYRVSGKGWRHENCAGIGGRGIDRLPHGIENRNSLMLGSTLTGSYPRHHLGPVFDALGCVEASLFAP